MTRGRPASGARASRRWPSCACGGRPALVKPWVCILPLAGLPSIFNLPLGKRKVEVAGVEGLMQDYELSLQDILWRIERLHQKKEIVTKVEQGLHRMTNQEMVPRINRLAGALKRLGVKPGDRVATLAFNNHRHLELYYAVPCMGAVLHTLNLRLFPQHLEFIIKDAEDKTLFVDQALLPLLKPLVGKIPSIQRIVLMTDASAPSHNPEGLGEMLDYETLLAAERDTVLPIVPMFHANSWGLPYACGMAGCKVLFPDRWMGDAKSVVELAEQEGATILAGVPTIWIGTSALLKETGKRLPNVHTVICGGSAIPRALMEAMDGIGLRMLHAWGMTETSPLGSVARPRAGTKQEDELNVRLTQGVIVPGVELRITDPSTGEELPWDGVAFGEIQVRGPWIARGYHNGYDPDKLTEDGWFRTGDVAKVTPEGYIQIVDRTKDVIKSGGEWISSVELENAVMAHPKILEAAVIGLAHPRWDERPVVYAVARSEFKGQVTEDEIKEFLKS